jgi:hypothetical protein
MANKKTLLGIFSFLLVFGLFFTGCPNDSDDSGGSSQGDPLNGSWAEGAGQGQQTVKLDNGNFEISENSSILFAKGSYTTSSGKITMSITHIHGGYLINQMGSYAPAGLESKWYSKSELKTAAGLSDAEFEQSLGGVFIETTASYSVNGNTLTMSYQDGNTTTYTRN